MSGRTENLREAVRIGNEVETLYTNGPAAGGGAWKSARDVVAVASVLLPRELAKPQIRFVGAAKVKLREIAHSRTGDKGNISNISVIAYDAKHYPLLLEQVTAARVKSHFAGVVQGEVVRYELPNLSALNFVMDQALGGGVTRSLALDAHGKSLSSALLDLDIEPAPDGKTDGNKESDDEIMPDNPTLATLAADLDAGRTTARKLVEECLARIADPAGEGAARLHSRRQGRALAAADAMDRLRKAHAAPSPFAGIPVSIKDLFDIKGQVTRAGSRALDDSAPAEADAPVVARLRRAGFIVIGRTNMTEFAYSGIGINPHYGTPKSVWNRSVGHVPGGSSSGAAVSIADRHGPWRARHRYRRLLPDSGGLQRHRRLQADASAACRSTAACRCRFRSTALGRWRAPSAAARCWTPCSPMKPCSRCSRARSRACGLRCRPRSRSTISTTRWRRRSSARWKRCRGRAR